MSAEATWLELEMYRRPARRRSVEAVDAAVLFGAFAGAAGSEAIAYLLLLRFVLLVPTAIVGRVFLVTRYGPGPHRAAAEGDAAVR